MWLTGSTASNASWRYLAAVVALVCLAGFAALTVAIFGHGPLLEVDEAVARHFAKGRPRWLLDVFTVETSTAAYFPAAAFLLAFSFVIARLRRAVQPVILAMVAVALVGASVATGKQVIGRSRIPFAADTFGSGGTSYPSGHTTTAVVVSGVVLILLAPRLSARGRRVGTCLVAAYAALTGFSRLYLHLHWFTDVLAGWLLGTAIVTGLAIVFVRTEPAPEADS